MYHSILKPNYYSKCLSKFYKIIYSLIITKILKKDIHLDNLNNGNNEEWTYPYCGR